MKTRKLLLPILLFAFLLPTALMAQNPTEKGRFLFDTDFSLNFGSNTMEDDFETAIDTRVVDFEFGFGYTIIDNLEIGIRAAYDHSYSLVENEFYTLEETDNLMTYGISARYYFLGESKLKPFVEAFGGMGGINNEITGSEDTKYKLTTMGGAVGMVYFFNDHYGLEVVYNYRKTMAKEDDNHAYSFDNDGAYSHLALGFVISF